MQIKYVGAKPIVDQHGVSFDKLEPDRYAFVHAAVELLEVLNGCEESLGCFAKEGEIDLLEWSGFNYSQEELNRLVPKYVSDIDAIATLRQERVDKLVAELKERVEARESLNSDEKIAWLGNIDIMIAYYKQFVENEIVFYAILDELLHFIKRENVSLIRFKLYRNYGMIFSYAPQRLEALKMNLDMNLDIKPHHDELIGELTISHPISSM